MRDAGTLVVVATVVACVLLWPVLGKAQVIPVGGTIPVNTTTAGNQSSPAAVVTHTPWDAECPSCFVVVWAGPADGGVTGIFMQRFTGDGVPIGTEESVSTAHDSDNQSPDVAADLNGNFVVVWRKSGVGVLARVWSGSEDGFGGEFTVTTSGSDPAVAQDPSSKFVVAYAFGSRIYVRRFDGEGHPLGGEVRVDSEGIQSVRPDVGMDVSGNFIVTWRCSVCEPNAEEGTYDFGVSARLYGADGDPLGAGFIVNAEQEGPQMFPSIGVGTGGNFVVAWWGGSDPEQLPETIYARAYNADASPLTGDVDVCPQSHEFCSYYPAVAASDPDGHFVVTWKGRGPEQTSTQGFARWYDSEGVAWEEPWTPGGENVQGQTLAGDIGGNFVLVWAEGEYDAQDIFAHLYERPVLLSVNDFAVLEGDPVEGATESTAVFTVQASKAHPILDVEVDFNTEDDTATFFEDYESTSGGVLFESNTGELNRPVAVAITPDLEYEPDETFFLNLSNVSNAAITRDHGTGTILNDDVAPALTISDVEGEEDDGDCEPGDPSTTTFLFQVTLTPTLDDNVTVDFATADGSENPAIAGSDYVATSGTLSIPGGSSGGWVAVEVLCDAVAELDEDFIVELSNPFNAVLADPEGVGTILDNDCYTISPTEHLGADPDGDSGIVTVTVTHDSCEPWTAETTFDWITFDPLGGTGSGEVQYTIDTNPDPVERVGTATIAQWAFTVTQLASGCDIVIEPEGESFPSWGGSGEVTVDAEPDLCEWTVTASEPWITVTSPSDGNGFGDGIVEYTVDVNPGVARSGSLIIGGHEFTVEQSGIFFDDFDDDVMAMGWNYDPPNCWEETGHSLRVHATGSCQSSRALTDWVFPGMVEGVVSTRMRVNLFSTGTATLYGWYEGHGDHVALTMDEFSNSWTLTQVVDGAVVQSASSNALPIEAHMVYDVELRFDGVDFVVTVDDVEILFMPPAAGSTPDGTVGFGVDSTDADFDEIMASVTTPSTRLFWDGFEPGDTSRWSAAIP